MKISKNKQKKIIEAKATLKAKFVGLDNIIDEIFYIIQPWYFNNGIIKKPIIVNLWGMTGTGKTDLVRSLVKELNLDNYQEFDTAHMNSISTSKDLYEKVLHLDGKKNVFLFDEFQKIQTLNPKNPAEIINEEYHLKEIWSLLSDGKIIKNFDYKYIFFQTLSALGKENNQIGKTAWEISMLEKYSKLKGKEFYEALSNDPKSVLQESLKTVEKLNGKDEVNLKDSLIFICGNIDEPFKKENSFSLDNNILTADDLHEISTNVSKLDIQNSLKKIFRFEQVSRLGNNHFVMPNLNKKDYLSLINREIDSYKKTYEKQYKVKISYNNSLTNLIYKTGFTPSLGVRKLHHSIYYYFCSSVQTYLNELDNSIKEINIEVSGQNLSINSKNILIEDNPKFKLDKRVILHEIGHLIIGAKLFKTLPKSIYLAKNEKESSFVKFKTDMKTKKEYLNMVSVYLGGYSIEKLKYNNNVSHGSQSDLAMATDLLTQMVKKYGMGDHLIVNYNTQNLKEASNSLNKQDDKFIENIMQKQLKKNIKILKENKLLIDKIFEELNKTNYSFNKVKKIIKKNLL